MLLVLLIVIPFIFGVLNFAIKGTAAKKMALASSLLTLLLATLVCKENTLTYQSDWIPSLGASFSLISDSMARVLVLLTAIVMLVIFIAQWNKPTEQAHRFYGLMSLAQAGLMGVFLANDLLLFYFFWELALIPVYFLSSQWGGEKRIQATIKFFIYTFLGGLLMLGGVIYLYFHTPERTFDYATLIQTGSQLPEMTQQILFWFFFVAFAIKMPIFPFHTWQPDAYEQSATPITIVLSALMVKMGLFATLKWVQPVLPNGFEYWANTIMILSIIGLIYASFLAMIQSDIKRLIAYSSIAHIGLMSLAIFAQTEIATQGVIVQMFNHGINIMGMWLLVAMIEQRYGTRNMKELGGMAGAAPWMSIALVIIAFANISLPLTNAFVGEFMLFHGIFESANPNHITYMVLAGLGIIFGAVYTLNMVQKVAYGDHERTKFVQDLQNNEWIGITIVIGLIIVLGIYPTLLYDLIAN